MAKGAANEQALGKVHALVTSVFTKVLENYNSALDALPSAGDLRDELEGGLAEAMAAEPNPAMLSAITKFLKDNSVSFDDEAVKGLSGLQQALADRREARKNVVQLTTLRAVGDD